MEGTSSGTSGGRRISPNELPDGLPEFIHCRGTAHYRCVLLIFLVVGSSPFFSLRIRGLRMDVLEYISKITKNGSLVALTRETVNEVVNHTGDGAGSFTNVTLYHGETPGEHRENEKMLEKVTTCALCCDDPELFYEHVSIIIPEKYKRCGVYVAEEWSRLLNHMWISCSMLLTTMVIQERYQKSAKVLLEILQTRIKEWRRKAEGKVTKDLDKDGNPTGGFTFVMEGGLL